MFFCVGENDASGYSFGSGSTIEDAVVSWANSEGWDNIVQEYEQYMPDTIQGEQIKVELIYKKPEFVIIP